MNLAVTKNAFAVSLLGQGAIKRDIMQDLII